MAKSFLALLVVAFSPGFLGAQSLDQVSGGALPDRPAAFIGSPLVCSQPPVIRVPADVVERAKLKVRLLDLLRESLYDDTKGIVNIAREKEIKKLASKLRNDN